MLPFDVKRAVAPLAAIAATALALHVSSLLPSPAFAEGEPMPKGATQSAGESQKEADKAAKAPGGESSGPNDKKTDSANQSENGAKPVETVNGNEPEIPPYVEWSFAGMFGRYDQAQLQRGYQVYKEVCANCHSMKLVAFHNLEDIGYSAGQVKALAETFQIQDGPNDQGEMYKRPGRGSDYFPSPFPNEEAAAAAYGKAPPDMSTLAKARGWERGFPTFLWDFFTQYEEVEGPTYIHAILNGYTHEDDPKWNLYMPNHKIAMPKPLSDGQVDYTDGSPKTLDQYSKDVSAFLMWAAEPKLEARKAMGVRVLIFLIVFATLLFFVKKRIWASVGGDVVVGAPSTSGSAGRPYGAGNPASK